MKKSTLNFRDPKIDLCKGMHIYSLKLMLISFGFHNQEIKSQDSNFRSIYVQKNQCLDLKSLSYFSNIK